MGEACFVVVPAAAVDADADGIAAAILGGGPPQPVLAMESVRRFGRSSLCGFGEDGYDRTKYQTILTNFALKINELIR